MRFLKKIKASALQFAILVSVIVALLLGSFLTLTHIHRFFDIQSELFLNVIEASQKGIEFGFDSKNILNDSVSIETEKVSTIIKKNSWGGYIAIQATSTSKTKSFSKIGWIGSIRTDPATGIYVSDTQLPLFLVGDTQIEGTAYISNKGIQRGVILRHTYKRRELVKGVIKSSNGSLPELNNGWVQDTKRFLDYIPTAEDMVIPVREENTNSFFNLRNTIYNTGKMRLAEKYIGNIIIKSETEIIVTRNATLVDVLLIAPKITVEKGFRGNAHLLANKAIKIEEEVILLYPSSLVLIDKNEEVIKPIPKGEEPVYISGNTRISGSIIYLSNNDIDNRSNTSIAIRPASVIEGSIYCSGNTELSGAVFGAVYTHRFITNEFGSKYINHIYNGKVLGNTISSEYCGLPFQQDKKGVVKWLY